MEAGPTGGSDPDALLRAIEAVHISGAVDLGQMGFWNLIAQVKKDPALIEGFADRLAAIDTQAFRAGVRLRVPVWLGNALLLLGVAVGAGAAGFALRPGTSKTLAGLALLLSGVVWSVSFHCPAHWLVGRLTGIRFTDYFLGGPPPPRPGLKIDYATYLRADPAARAWMHASGAIATKLAPFLALAFWPASGAPWWSASGLLALGVLQISTDVLFSVRSSDWKRFGREMALARSPRRDG